MARKKIKTLKEWEASGLDRGEYLQPLDEIDEELYWDIACGFVPAHYQHGGLIQGGDPEDKIDGVAYTYETVTVIDGRFYYLGVLPEFKQYKYAND